MSAKKRLFIIIAVVVALLIAGVSALFLGGNSSTPDLVSPTSNPTSSAAPIVSQTPTPTVETTEEAKKEIAKITEFADAAPVSGFNKEDVQEVLKTATEYSYNSLTNQYYLSGTWAKDGMPNNIDVSSGRFFAPEIREKIKAFDTNPATGKSIGKDVLPIVFFVRPAGSVEPSPDCTNSAEKASGCTVDGLKISTMDYVPTFENDKPGVKVTFSASTKVPVKYDGKNMYTEVTYDYILNFISNEAYEETISPYKFVINDYNVTVKTGGVQPNENK